MAHANQKHSNQSPSNAQLKSALSLIAAEIARGPLRSSSLSKITRDTFGGSDASGVWSWRTRRRVAGDVRLEIGGADKGTIDGVKALGCFTEIIAFQLRVFVPHGVGVDTAAILARIVGDGHARISNAA